MDTKVDKTKRIRELNDAFRRTFTGGRVMLTSGVDALPADMKAQVLQAVRSFDSFDNSNDPHREHDFGAFTIDDVRCFWKTDVFADAALKFGSEHPEDPARSFRVMTLMRADEY